MLIFSIFSAVVCLVFTLAIGRNACKCIRQAKDDIRYYSVRLRLQKIERHYYLCETKGVLTSYPSIVQYFNQVPRLLDLDMKAFRNIKFVPMKSADSAYIASFKKEVVQAPEEVVDLLLRVSDSFDQMVAIQHPFKGWRDSIKKKLMMRILNLLLDIANKKSNKAIADKEKALENQVQKKRIESIWERPLPSTNT